MKQLCIHLTKSSSRLSYDSQNELRLFTQTTLLATDGFCGGDVMCFL
jgi:hypothetical protein